MSTSTEGAGVVTRAIAQAIMDSKTKPLGALGQLENIGVRLSVLQQTLQPRVDRARVCVFGADHGVTDEGVSAYPRAVTAEMMKNFNAGGAAINVLARANNVDVEVIDVGVDADISALGKIVHAKVAKGTRNFAKVEAMSDEQLRAALDAGTAAAQRAHSDGMQALCLGEMGIGNTTTASALLSALTHGDVSLTVGLGTGISEHGLVKKRDVVERALALHGRRSNAVAAMECLRRLGGFELAAIAGAAIEAARLKIVVVADGFISTVAILCASYIATEESVQRADDLFSAVFLSHQSAERGHKFAIDAYGQVSRTKPVALLDLGMRLGEGTGAALAIPLIRCGASVMREMATFASAGIPMSNEQTQK